MNAQGKGTKHNQDSEDEPMHLTIRLNSHSKNIGCRERLKKNKLTSSVDAIAIYDNLFVKTCINRVSFSYWHLHQKVLQQCYQQT